MMFHDKHRTRHGTAHRDDGVTAPARPAVSDDVAVEDLLRTLHDERGFAFATLQNHRRSLRPFLAWLAERARPWAETTLDDVSAYLASRPRWSRATLAFHVQCLRTLFRHGAVRGWCRPRFANTIEAPRLYTHERLPQGPQWSDVQRLLNASRGDTATQIRNYAMLVLLAVYGFRSGEVRGLTLDDIDWERERIHPPRPKQRRVGEYPLVREVGEAILRYLRYGSAHWSSPLATSSCAKTPPRPDHSTIGAFPASQHSRQSPEVVVLELA